MTSTFQTALVQVTGPNGPRVIYVQRQPVTYADFDAFCLRTDYHTSAQVLEQSSTFRRNDAIATLSLRQRDRTPVCCVSPEDAQTYAKVHSGRLLTYPEWIACFRISDDAVDEDTYHNALLDLARKRRASGGIEYSNTEIVQDGSSFLAVHGPAGFNCTESSDTFTFPLGYRESYLLISFRICFDVQP